MNCRNSRFPLSNMMPAVPLAHADEEMAAHIFVKEKKMNLHDAIEKRRTIRSFMGEATEEQLRRIISEGTKAPSAKNAQPWEFIIVKNQDVIKQLAELKGELSAIKPAASEEELLKIDQGVLVQKKSFDNVSLVAVCNNARRRKSVWLCIQNMLLASVAEGLGAGITLYWGDPRKRACQLLKIPEDFELTCLVKIGVPGEEGYCREKNPWNQRRKDFSWLHFEKFGNKSQAIL